MSDFPVYIWGGGDFKWKYWVYFLGTHALDHLASFPDYVEKVRKMKLTVTQNSLPTTWPMAKKIYRAKIISSFMTFLWYKRYIGKIWQIFIVFVITMSLTPRFTYLIILLLIYGILFTNFFKHILFMLGVIRNINKHSMYFDTPLKYL